MSYCDQLEPDRYTPSISEARRRGNADLASIKRMIGDDKCQRILEVGCGCGSLLLALKEQGYKDCTGVDTDELLVRHGRDRLGVKIVHGDWAGYLGASSEQFDCIVALDVVEHTPPDELLDLLRITRSRLSFRGRFIVRAPNALCPFALPTLYGDLTHTFIVVPRTFSALLRMAGFEGNIMIEETRPAAFWKNVIFTAVHRLIVRPLVGLAYYHFHGELPSHLTANVIFCAWANGVLVGT